MIVTLLAEKGGVGKSTIADEIFASFERTGVPVAMMNTDAQYGDTRRGDVNAAEVVVVDTPGALPDNVGDMVGASDAVIVPCRPSARNVEPTCRVITLVREVSREVPVIVVVMGTATRSVAAMRFAKWLKGWLDGEGYTHGVKLCGIPQSEAFAAAEAEGMSVVDLVRKRRGRYAREVEPALMTLLNCVRELGGYPHE